MAVWAIQISSQEKPSPNSANPHVSPKHKHITSYLPPTPTPPYRGDFPLHADGLGNRVRPFRDADRSLVPGFGITENARTGWFVIAVRKIFCRKKKKKKVKASWPPAAATQTSHAVLIAPQKGFRTLSRENGSLGKTGIPWLLAALAMTAGGTDIMATLRWLTLMIAPFFQVV